MKDNRIKNALEQIARRNTPENIDLWPRISNKLGDQKFPFRIYHARPIVIIALGILILLMITGVAYAIGHVLGFIPGIGIIEQGSSLRVVSGPVTATRNGITITIEQSILSGDKTTVVYRVEGIPANAYPQNRSVAGCIKSPEIHLADGATLYFSDSGENIWKTGYESKVVYSAISGSANTATFFVPCIYGSLPGSLPENWELPMRFVSAPPNLTVIPVIEISPSPESNESTPVPANQPLNLEKVVETQDGYILIGNFQMNNIPANITILDSQPQIKITDADGRNIITKVPVDVSAVSNKKNEFAWAYEIKGKNQSWPLTITVDAINVGLSDPGWVRLDFNTGPNPQLNQNWILNKDISSNGYRVTLVSIHRMADGYRFGFKAEPQVSGIGVRIESWNAIGGGGGGDGKGSFEQSNIYVGTLPSGKLTLGIAVQSVHIPGPWSITWRPDVLPTVIQNQLSTPGAVCLTNLSLSTITPPPANWIGKVLLYSTLDGMSWATNLINLDGSQNQKVLTEGNWATLSPDNSHLVYSGADGKLHIMDMVTREDRVLGDVAGYNPRLSLDGQQVAAVDKDGITIIKLADSSVHRIPLNAIALTLAGWSADGTKVFITTPGAQGFILQTVDISTGVVEDLFKLENSSWKAPYATVSPDGNWIAYRDQENSGLYLERTDGSGTRLAARMPATISSIVWSQSSKWLGISLTTFNTSERTVLIFQPDSCVAFVLPNLHGEIQGLVMP